MAGVGIGEEEHVTGGGAPTLHAGPRLAVPPGRQFRAVQQAEARVLGHEALDDRGGVVGGAVIHDDDLEVPVP